MNLDSIRRDGHWSSIVRRLSRGDPIERQEVVEALNSESPIPDAIRPFLASIIKEDYKFKRGRKADPWSNRINRTALQMAIEVWLSDFESWISNPSRIPTDIDTNLRRDIEQAARRANYKKRKSKTPHAQAKEMVAEDMGISVRKLEELLMKYPQSRP